MQTSTIMIPKPGKDPHNPFSYRPISLLNITGKIFEKILTNRLKDFLETAAIRISLAALHIKPHSRAPYRFYPIRQPQRVHNRRLSRH